MKKIPIFLFILFCLKGFSQEQRKVIIAAEKTAFFIGDQTNITLNFEAYENMNIDSIGWNNIESTKFEVIETAPVKVVSPSEKSASAIITSFEVGEITLPAIPIYRTINYTEKDTIYSDSVKFTIYPVEPDSTGIAPIKDIIEEKKDITDYKWYILVTVLLLLAGAYYLYWRQQQLRKKANLYEIEQNNRSKALKKLQILAQKQLPQQSKHKVFCSELTFIIKEFLAKEYQFGALEMTSSEIIKHCKSENILTEQINDLTYLLNISDFVKFAEGETEFAFFDEAVKKAEICLAQR